MRSALQTERLRLRVRGRVQGVGFRPFVHALAGRHGLSGWVHNDTVGVEVEIEGEHCEAFVRDLSRTAPPLVRITGIETERIGTTGKTGFQITGTQKSGAIAASIPPDVALCEACLGELFDPKDRRFLHPFITCTNCGPRFTITWNLPYDRSQTSMDGFAMCPSCRAEYEDPANRRFHAEPVACHDCGPQLDVPVSEMIDRIGWGEILAIKGLGGFHLAVDARNAEAVDRLRIRKGRQGKPLAVMVANLESAKSIAEINQAEADALSDPSRPVVVVKSKGVLPPAVSEGLPTIGVMLPYTPLHWLLFHQAAGRPEGIDWTGQPQHLALVMTSANASGDPLITRDREARKRLAGVVDAIAGNDREIVTRCDDAVVRVIANSPVYLRRSRGFVPDTIPLAEDGENVVALGALLKTAACVTREREAIVGQHVGDLRTPDTVRFLRESVTHISSLLGVAPKAAACDLHADYPSTLLAETYGIPVFRIQHHQAHLASVAAEYGITGALTGLVLDGFGLGPDGTLWGGELLSINGTRMERLGHLRPMAMPGGDQAARCPWRMAVSMLQDLGWTSDAIRERFPDHETDGVVAMLGAGINSPLTSSAGRLFDAAAGLLGVRMETRFEGEAAMALEGLVTQPNALKDGFALKEGVLDFRPLMTALAECTPQRGADLFHGTLTEGLAALATSRLPDGEIRIALTGGCIANRVLTETLCSHFKEAGIEVLIPRQVPPGDGGLALGQALIARRMLKETG